MPLLSKTVVTGGSTEEAKPTPFIRCFKENGKMMTSKSINLQLPSGSDMCDVSEIDNSERSYRVEGRDGPIFFPLATVLPKVQMLKVIEKKKCPKDVAVERRYREYTRTNLELELAKAGIKRTDLHPTADQFNYMSDISFTHYFPLSFFDDTRYETRSVSSWLELSKLEEAQFEGVPAKAYVPINQSMVKYAWQIVSVVDFDTKSSLWRVINLVDFYEYTIPSIQMVFIAEDPMNFVRRVKKAHKLRQLAENRTRIFLMIEMCLFFEDKELFFNGHKRTDAVLSSSNCALWFQDELRDEVIRIFHRVMASFDMDSYLMRFPDDLPSFKNIVVKDLLPKLPRPKIKVNKLDYKIRLKRFTKKILDLNRRSLFYNVAAFEAMQSVVLECYEAEQLSLFVVIIAKPMPLADFVSAQTAHNQGVANFLTKVWPTKIATNIVVTLRQEGKGFLDVTLNKFVIYLMCKIPLFIYQVKMRMEFSIQSLLESSIENFMNILTGPCKGFVNLPKDFVWDGNYRDSLFPCKNPIFFLILSISDSREAVYSTAPEEFEPALLELFKKCLEKINAIPCIDAQTMLNLTFDPKLYIRTVELIETTYIIKNAYLKHCFRQAVIPLRAYLRKYDTFIDFFLVNLNSYMLEYAAERKPSLEVKTDIIYHREEMQNLEHNLPDLINIGPFQINVQQTKRYLINKHDELQKKIIDYYIDRMYETTEELLEEGTKMFNKINDRPISIEDLIDIREFAANLPELLEKYKGDIQIMGLEYDILDYFFINITDTQFGMKWAVIAWPYKIVKRLATLRDEQKIDFEDFKRLHNLECAAFDDRLTSLNEEIQNYSIQFDAHKVMEMYADIKKSAKNINDIEGQGAILQSRQKLFEMPPLNFMLLEKIKMAFTPYKILWTAGAEAHKLQEATTGNPMSMVDLKEVWKTVNDLRLQLVEVSKEFEEVPELQTVATVFLRYIKSFAPILEAMKFLKNENWLVIHWQELNSTTGSDIKYNPQINFQYLVKKGIMEHLDLVREIGTRAIEEADEIRARLEEEERLRREAELRALFLKEQRKCRRDIL